MSTYRADGPLRANETEYKGFVIRQVQITSLFLFGANPHSKRHPEFEVFDEHNQYVGKSMTMRGAAGLVTRTINGRNPK